MTVQRRRPNASREIVSDQIGDMKTSKNAGVHYEDYKRNVVVAKPIGHRKDVFLDFLLQVFQVILARVFQVVVHCPLPAHSE